jgi:membrane protease subunit HflC
MKATAIIAFLLVIIIIVLGGSIFVVDETEQVILTQFGKPVRGAIRTPGINFKVPFIQQTHYFAKNLLEWDGDPGQIPTLDKTYIWVDVFARWLIIDPLKFYKAAENEIAGQKKLDDIIDPATRNYITSNHLIEAVRSTNDTTKTALHTVLVGREHIEQGIREQAAKKLLDFGIELVDVRIKRINYVDEVLQTVYGRMVAERRQIAEKFRSEGRGESMKIAGNKEKELKRISSEAYKTAEEVKGKADAEATKIYASAYNRDPEFYSFLKSLEIYKKAIDKDTWLFLSTKTDFFRYLKKYRR